MTDLRESLRRLADTALTLLQTRLELIQVELQQGSLAVFDALVMAVAALMLLLFGVGCALSLVWVLCPPAWQPWVLGAATLALLAAGALLLRRSRARLAGLGQVFGGSVSELAADREAVARHE